MSFPVFQSAIAQFITWLVVYAQGKAREGCSARNSAGHQSGGTRSCWE